jgi:hypothetical protein
MFKPHCPRCQSSRLQLGFKDTPLPLRLVGVQELLCNNCNLEFKGVAFGKLERAKATHEETIRNRRRAPRFKVKVPFTLAVLIKDPRSQGVKYSPMLHGHTVDISGIGLALFLPDVRAGEYDVSAHDQRLWLKLELPTGAVVMRVSPVRREKMAGGGSGAGWIIGAHIRQIDEADSAQYHAYVETLASEPT